MQYIFIKVVDGIPHIAIYIVKFCIVDIVCLICIIYIDELHLYKIYFAL